MTGLVLDSEPSAQGTTLEAVLDENCAPLQRTATWALSSRCR